jgi:hypothetical protein
MRWFVEISSLGQSAQPSRTLCVEAPQWQPALQKARALRGDGGPLSNFSIELLESGYRAIDPTARVRYQVQRAPDDAALTDGGEPTAGTPAEIASPEPPAAAAPDPASLPPMRPMAETVPFISEGLALVHPPSPPASVPRGRDGEGGASAHVDADAERRAPPDAEADGDGGASTQVEADGEGRFPNQIENDEAPKRARAHTISFSSEGSAARHAAVAAQALHAASPSADPTERSPLTYRELVYAVAPGTSEQLVEALLLARFEEARRSLDDVRPGKLINVAVFDHVFQGRPARRPVATLAWKDWRSQGPEIRFPLRDGEVASAPPSSSMPSPLAQLRSDRAAVSVAPSSAASPRPASSPPRRKRASIPPKSGARLSGDDLIAELFEACSDLHFLRDALEGADFVLALTLEKIPSTVGLVSLFDINRREFVVVRQRGGKSALLARLPERAPLVQAAMRSQRAVVVPDASRDERALDDRWKAIGGELSSVICAPVELAGRYLGLIEVANPLDGGRFSEGDGNALTYIGQQFAEFVGARGVIVDPDIVTSGARKAGR